VSVETQMTATHRDRFGRTINRDHSPVLSQGVPLATILVGSLTPLLPIVASGPVVPPLGFMLLLAWRIQRPGLLPMWIGLPLGAFDDLFSGQPFGCAIMLWSLALLALEAIETRFPWRGFWQDWATAAGLIVAYLAIGAIVADGHIELWRVPLVLPQVALGILLFPLVARLVAFFDRVRLIRVRHLD